MPSKKPAPARHDDLDNYDVGYLSDDPFRSPSPPSRKRKEPEKSGLGIEEEVSVQKRARVPNVKLDEDRYATSGRSEFLRLWLTWGCSLLGPAGIPKLRTRARTLKIKSKGHEFSDAGRLLSLYQLWLDDLFPKAKFLDALAMVEKAGHKKRIVTARSAWINEGKPIHRSADDDDDQNLDITTPRPADQAPTLTAPRPATPTRDHGVPDEDDLYDATPRHSAIRTVPIINKAGSDADSLEALMAEAEVQHIIPKKQPPPREDPDEDDLDALMAEAEGHDTGKPDVNLSKTEAAKKGADDFADDEAAMQEMDGLW